MNNHPLVSRVIREVLRIVAGLVSSAGVLFTFYLVGGLAGGGDFSNRCMAGFIFLFAGAVALFVVWAFGFGCLYAYQLLKEKSWRVAYPALHKWVGGLNEAEKELMLISILKNEALLPTLHGCCWEIDQYIEAHFAGTDAKVPEKENHGLFGVPHVAGRP